MGAANMGELVAEIRGRLVGKADVVSVELEGDYPESRLVVRCRQMGFGPDTYPYRLWARAGDAIDPVFNQGGQLAPAHMIADEILADLAYDRLWEGEPPPLRRVLMRAEIGAETPFWTCHGTLVNEDALPLSEGLRQRLRSWVDALYEADDDTPAARRWDEEGLTLYEEVCQEIGTRCDVFYDQC
jgi:hypothetical protein